MFAFFANATGTPQNIFLPPPSQRMPYHHTVKTDKNESFIIGMIKKYWKSLTNRNAKTMIITILVIVVLATSIGLGVGLASKDSKENGSHIKTRSTLDFKVHRPDGFYEPEPIFPRNHNCDLGLRLVLSGFMGHGKVSNNQYSIVISLF